MGMNHRIIKSLFCFQMNKVFDSVNTKERFGDFCTYTVYMVFKG